VDLWLNVPVGATVTILTFARIRENVGPRAPLDVGGVVPATAAALGLVWGPVRANPAGWSSTEVRVALAGGVALAVAFVTWELRCADGADAAVPGPDVRRQQCGSRAATISFSNMAAADCLEPRSRPVHRSNLPPSPAIDAITQSSEKRLHVRQNRGLLPHRAVL
jgi:hypothetical protein